MTNSKKPHEKAQLTEDQYVIMAKALASIAKALASEPRKDLKPLISRK